MEDARDCTSQPDRVALSLPGRLCRVRSGAASGKRSDFIAKQILKFLAVSLAHAIEDHFTELSIRLGFAFRRLFVFTSNAGQDTGQVLRSEIFQEKDVVGLPSRLFQPFPDRPLQEQVDAVISQGGFNCGNLEPCRGKAVRCGKRNLYGIPSPAGFSEYRGCSPRTAAEPWPPKP